eukprot:4995363-Pleurochrysis_carterae.AAC.1
MSQGELLTDKFGAYNEITTKDQRAADPSPLEKSLLAAAISCVCAFLLLRLCEPPFIYDVPHALSVPRVSLRKLIHGSLFTALCTALFITCVPRSSVPGQS